MSTVHVYVYKEPTPLVAIQMISIQFNMLFIRIETYQYYSMTVCRIFLLI